MNQKSYLRPLALLTAFALATGLGADLHADLTVGQIVGVDFDDGGSATGAGVAGNGYFVVNGIPDGVERLGFPDSDSVAGDIVNGLVGTISEDTTGANITGGGVSVSFNILPLGNRFGQNEGSGLGTGSNSPIIDFGPVPAAANVTPQFTNDSFFTNGAIEVIFGNLDDDLTYNVYSFGPGNNLQSLRVGDDAVISPVANSAGGLGLDPAVLLGVSTDGDGSLTVRIAADENIGADASVIGTAPPFDSFSLSGFRNFFGVSGVILEATAVPEPGSLVVLSVMGTVVGLRRRRT